MFCAESIPYVEHVGPVCAAWELSRSRVVDVGIAIRRGSSREEEDVEDVCHSDAP